MVIQNKLTKSITERVTAFQGDPRTSWIRGREKSAGPALLIVSLLICAVLYNICKIPVTTSAESYGTALSVQDDTYLNVAIPNSVVLNITPTAAGQFAKTSMDISVDTNNATGYTLTMTADTTSLSRTSAVNGVDYTIPTLSTAATCTDESDTTCDTFPVGYWGYKFTNAEVASSSTYNPVSTNVTKLRFQKDFNSSVDTTTVTFGTKLSNSIPNGTYDGVNLTFIATTNYVIPETAKYMQDFNAVIADSLTPGITYTTKDSRDNQDYTVAKLADGNVWMTKNLNLAGGTTITPADSNVAENYILPASSMIGFHSDSNTAWVYNSNNDDCTQTEIGCYSYYSFRAATANSGTSSPSDTTASAAPYDICPKGWRLPTTSKNEFDNSSDIRRLAISLGGSPTISTYTNETIPTGIAINNILRNDTYRFMLSGGVNNSKVTEVGTDGNYWTSVNYYSQDVNTYIAYYYKIRINPYWQNFYTNTDLFQRLGFAVRCVKDRSMQNFSATDAAAMSEGQTITLVDNRDGKEYEVTKINGRVWMTQNLAFTGTQLTPADSNVSTNTTIEWNDLASDGENGGKCDANNGFNNACNIISTNNAQGVWYNYAAASAMTITGATNSTRDTHSICPKGWQLPDSYTTLTDGFFGDSTLFPQVYGGWVYPGGGVESNGIAYYWTRSNSSATNRFIISVAPNANVSGANTNRTTGCYIRCIFFGE